jgi:hypothetical protein
VRTSKRDGAWARRRTRDDEIFTAILALTRDPIARDLLMELSIACGYGLCCAVFGTEAIRVLVNDPPGLVVVDLDIPDGRALVRSMQVDERWRGVPLIVLAASDNDRLDMVSDAAIYLKPELIGLETAIMSRFDPNGYETEVTSPYLYDEPPHFVETVAP